MADKGGKEAESGVVIEQGTESSWQSTQMTGGHYLLWKWKPRIWSLWLKIRKHFQPDGPTSFLGMAALLQLRPDRVKRENVTSPGAQQIKSLHNVTSSVPPPMQSSGNFASKAGNILHLAQATWWLTWYGCCQFLFVFAHRLKEGLGEQPGC